MSHTFKELDVNKQNDAIAAILCPQIQSILYERAPGHCMRVTDLDDDIMELVCSELRKQQPDANVYILANNQEMDSYRITSTKLVELRNPLANGELRPPLLVFIPISLRTSAEDSFGVATFEDLSFTEVYKELIDALLERVPATLVGYVRSIFQLLDEENWIFADEVAKVRYLLTAIENGVDGETLGASLYELMLIPDFKLFHDPVLINGKIHRNLECVRQLMSSHKSIRGRVADLGLSDKTLIDYLNVFFEQFDIQEPEKWTRPITLDRKWWSISYDKWKFKEELSLDTVNIVVVETDLPVVKEDESDEQLSELIGQQVLIPSKRQKIKVVFEVNPTPTKVRGLDHFTIQILSHDGSLVGKSKKVNVGSKKGNKFTVQLTKLHQVDFEEGWHYIRVLPWTAEGDPIPMVEDRDSYGSPKGSNESELFYVKLDGFIEDSRPQRAIPKEKSLEHARIRLQLTALNDDRDPNDIVLNEISWLERGKKGGSKEEVLMAKFGREGTVQIPVSRILKDIEQQILSKPEHLSGWRLFIDRNSPGDLSEIKSSLLSTMEVESFLAARTEFFNAVRKGSFELVVQATSFRDLEPICMSYTNSYLNLVQRLTDQAQASSGTDQQIILQQIRKLLAVDSIQVVMTDFRGRQKEAILVAPTHPIRVLWQTAWTKLGQQWIRQLKDGGKDHIPSVRDALLKKLQPLHFPVGIPAEDGRIFASVDNLTPFWGLYAPTTENNTRGLLAEICTILGLPEPTITVNELSANVLASKIERYLSQHPYVRELSINFFNPGTGSVLAEVLVALQQKREFSDLRYNIRLFSAEPDEPSLGEVLEEMLKLGSDLAHEAADIFAVSTGSHLHSKLKLGKHAFSDFRNKTKQYSAHISILLDVFPAEELGVKEATESLVPLYGLIQDYQSEFVDDDNGSFWHKSPVIGDGLITDNKDSAFKLLSSLNKSLCLATSAVATSGANFKGVPMITLGLNVEQRELIHEVHQLSDWVITIDRNMGIEFFDHGGYKNRPDYLIDFVPGADSPMSHNLIISSRSTDELVTMLKPVMESHGLSVGQDQAAEILSHLRSLSGQLALKLISAPTQQAEALGLALARLYLEYQGALSNQIIVPLDAHIELYRAAGENSGEDVFNYQRTDLALFDLDLKQKNITCNLIEVKCYSEVGSLAAYNQLKERITQQINQSERILQRHFDPSWKSPDRPDRLLKSRELEQILKFYLERAIRYGIFDSEAAQEAREFLQSIENGYTLRFQRCALIFDFEKNGTESPDNEVGIEFHRIGRDLIHALLEGCRVKRDAQTSEENGATSQSLSDLFIPEVPKLQTAAFIAPNRERITTVEEQVISSVKDENEDKQSSKQSLAAESSRNNEYKQKKTDLNLVQQDADEGNEIIIDPFAEYTSSAKESSQDEKLTSGKIDEKSKVKEKTSVDYDVILGVSEDSPQYGILGEVASRKVAIDLNQTNTISLFGVQGGGKSYTLGTVVEMATMPIENVNTLPSPLATVIFHYSPTQDYAPEFTSMIHANAVETEVNILRERFAGNPQALKDVLILTPADKLEERQAEYPDIEVRPIAFSSSELKATHWKFLMGAVGNQSMYMRQVTQIMRRLRNNLTLSALKNGINDSSLSDHLKELALTRLQFAGEYIDDSQSLQSLIRPGRLIIVDLRDEYIEKDEALGLFVVMLQIFSEAKFENQPFNKLVVFDEAHKYIENDDLVSELVEVVREMRHKGTSIMVASQDPPSVPISLIEFSTQIIMHKFNSPAWLKHIQKANAALSELTPEKMSWLGTGEAYVWSSKASDDSFTKGAVKIKCRPRVTQHGGGTKTAVKI
ncbi:ATP-binding protein [Paenactinomyces guangxiensis]|uniref:ATP-binding protein n=1 Tax=Paenactinomyces guangxiensis TaxID=1490290 RepID=A0A7W1WUJ2_9BACL|nr:ATP-binding protein [Paenactinomyces guangxiensis]MBA4496311.1 ATP-binding protein [Paenactinomyces guangxiensis]MBH8593457.1 ATP-binding protein [Paenactinomyces guangxiensis]